MLHLTVALEMGGWSSFVLPSQLLLGLVLCPSLHFSLLSPSSPASVLMVSSFPLFSVIRSWNLHSHLFLFILCRTGPCRLGLCGHSPARLHSCRPGCLSPPTSPLPAPSHSSAEGERGPGKAWPWRCREGGNGFRSLEACILPARY